MKSSFEQWLLLPADDWIDLGGEVPFEPIELSKVTPDMFEGISAEELADNTDKKSVPVVYLK